MEKSIKVFSAIAPGIAIGLYAAYQLGAYVWWLWILGAFVGGALSYLLFEFGTVLKAIPVAWNSATQWRPYKKAWRCLMIVTCGFLLLALTLMIVITSVALTNAAIEGGNFWSVFRGGNFLPSFSSAIFQILLTMIAWLSLIVLFASGCWWMCVLFACMFLFRGEMLERQISIAEGEAHWLIRCTNPIAVFFYWPVKGARHLPALAGSAWRFNKTFFRNLFLIIHSQDRSLCFTVTFLGVVVGYITHVNILASAIIGGIVGVIYAKSKAREWVIARFQNDFAH